MAAVVLKESAFCVAGIEMLKAPSLAQRSEPRASIIIVNWNGLDHLAACLGSLESQSFRDFEAILVDNGSDDGSVEWVRKYHPWVRLIPLNRNTGFATGNNLGLEEALGEFIITLNNDTCAEPDWLENLVRVADNYPRAGMIASRICSFDDPDIIDSLGMGICRDGMSRGRFRNRTWSALNIAEVEEILFPSACAALYRREMLQDCGFFDDDFFAYAEDTDLGLRGRLAGWQALLAAGAVVRHKYSQTSGELSPFKVRLVERNHYWVVLKNFPLGYLLALPWWTAKRYAAQVDQLLTGRGTGGSFLSSRSPAALVKAIAEGIFGAISGAPRMLAKRRRIMKNRKITTKELNSLLHRYQISFRELLDAEEAEPKTCSPAGGRR